MDSVLFILNKKISELESIIKIQNNDNYKNNKKFDIYYNKYQQLKFIKSQIPDCFSKCETLDQIEKLALAKLNLNAISYFISGSNSEITLNRNIDFFRKILIKPKYIKKQKNSFYNMINISTKVFGKEINFPIGFSPSALHKLATEEGEISSAKSAHKNKTIFILSSRASVTIEEVAQANKDGIRWFQLYVMKNGENNIKIIKEAEKHGFSGLVLTVDAPTIGYRDRDFQIKFKKPDNIHYAIEKNLLDMKLREDMDKSIQINKSTKDSIKKICNKSDLENDKNSGILNNSIIDGKIIDSNNFIIQNLQEQSNNANNFNYYKNSTDSSLDWNIIDWLRRYTSMPIILKGITNVSDAIRAAESNVEGIIISNHGGRQLDTSPSTIEVLEVIKNELEKYYIKFPHKKKMELFIDSGFRKGIDIFKALAYGAKVVFLGRPIVWGLAAGGELGVDKVLDILKNELEESMKISGCLEISDINEDCVYNTFHAKY